MESAVTIDLPGSPAVAVSSPLFDDFDAVVEQHWPRIYRYACAALGDPDDAQTIAQDCFMRAYRARAQFRGESALATWLIQIAVNLVRDRIRSRRLQFWRAAANRSVEVSEIYTPPTCGGHRATKSQMPGFGPGVHQSA